MVTLEGHTGGTRLEGPHCWGLTRGAIPEGPYQMLTPEGPYQGATLEGPPALHAEPV